MAFLVTYSPFRASLMQSIEQCLCFLRIETNPRPHWRHVCLCVATVPPVKSSLGTFSPPLRSMVRLFRLCRLHGRHDSHSRHFRNPFVALDLAGMQVDSWRVPLVAVCALLGLHARESLWRLSDAQNAPVRP